MADRRKRPLLPKELEEMVANLSDMEEDPFHCSDNSADSDYECSETDSSSESASDSEQSDNECAQQVIESESDISLNAPPIANVMPEPIMPIPKFDWSRNVNNLSPKFTIPQEEKPNIATNINTDSTIIQCFYAMFPKGLIMQIGHYTNLRLAILGDAKKKKVQETSAGEIKIVLGCMLVMSYNRLPAIHMYWSKHKSLGNQSISEAISRDRFILVMSKLYFNDPKKPADASKIYYIEEVMSCLKLTFLSGRTDSTFQSIDESMTKFKGRSSLKQYLPLKPVKRGIKLWTRSDAITGYVYDTNIYCGKENGPTDGTLGERVILKLAETIKNPNVTLCFDRFFTSTLLLSKIKYPCVGTYVSNRKNTPKFAGNLERGESEMAVCHEGIIAARWKDTKDVMVMSNCHDNSVNLIKRKMKDGNSVEVDCPESIIFYNKYMGGVDHADQMVSLYDLDRRSNKWWRKVFDRMLMTAVFNAYVIYNEKVVNKKIPFITFIIALAESLILEGRFQTPTKRSRRQGRVSKRVKYFVNIGDHLPVEKGGRNRCIRCKARKIEKRTRIVCQQCQVPLCINCFTPYHT